MLSTSFFTIFHCANEMNSMNELTSTQSFIGTVTLMFFVFACRCAIINETLWHFRCRTHSECGWIWFLGKRMWRFFEKNLYTNGLSPYTKIRIVRNAENTQSICRSIACEISIHNSLLLVHTRSGVLSNNPFVVLHRLQAINFVTPCREWYRSVHRMSIQLRLVFFLFSSFSQPFDAIASSGVSPKQSCVTDSFTITSLWCTLRCTSPQWPFRTRR